MLLLQQVVRLRNHTAPAGRYYYSVVYLRTTAVFTYCVPVVYLVLVIRLLLLNQLVDTEREYSTVLLL